MKTAPILYVAIGLMLLTVHPAAAQFASPVSYTYLEAGFEVAKYGAASESGVVLKGSVQSVEGMRVFGSYSVGSDNDGFYDYTDLELGLGSFTPASEGGGDGGGAMVIEWNIAYLQATVSSSGASWSGDGYYLDAGVRNQISPTLELNGGLRYRVMEGNNSRWLRVGMVLYSQPGRGITIDYLVSDANSSPYIIRVGYRILF